MWCWSHAKACQNHSRSYASSWIHPGGHSIGTTYSLFAEVKKAFFLKHQNRLYLCMGPWYFFRRRSAIISSKAWGYWRQGRERKDKTSLSPSRQWPDRIPGTGHSRSHGRKVGTTGVMFRTPRLQYRSVPPRDTVFVLWFPLRQVQATPASSKYEVNEESKTSCLWIPGMKPRPQPQSLGLLGCWCVGKLLGTWEDTVNSQYPRPGGLHGDLEAQEVGKLPLPPRCVPAFCYPPAPISKEQRWEKKV